MHGVKLGCLFFFKENEQGNMEMNPLQADSFSMCKIKVIPNKVRMMRLHTIIKYCIFRVNRLIFNSNLQVM